MVSCSLLGALLGVAVLRVSVRHGGLVAGSVEAGEAAGVWWFCSSIVHLMG
jgi:hypothetical protein